jgi:hypothetical protein
VSGFRPPVVHRASAERRNPETLPAIFTGLHSIRGFSSEKFLNPLQIGICPDKKTVSDGFRRASLRSKKRRFRVNSRPLYH